MLCRYLVLVETIHRFRTLLGKCELGVGLDWEEIDELNALETAFAPTDSRSGRRFRREKVHFTGIVRGDKLNDRVEIVELGPGGLVCRNAPFVARGEQVEVVIDDGDHSYRFAAEGVWLRDDGEDYRIALRLIGMPVCLNIVRVSAHDTDVVDKIPAAA
jgi:hypothetical protein